MPAQDSRPQLISRSGGAWSTFAELEKAAASGNPRACAELGERLALGNGAPKDVPRAIPLLERGARGGNANAAFRLGNLFEHGDGVPKDPARALAYFRAAAAGGVAEAYYNVGASLASGRGARADFVEALAWMILARQHSVAIDGESSIRTYLTETKHLDWIKRGEARAPKLAEELAARPLEYFLPSPASVAGTESPAAGKEKADGKATLASRRGMSIPAAPAPTLDLSTSNEPNEKTAHPITVMSINAKRLTWPSLDELQRAARANDPKALFALGQLYLDGEKVPSDVDLALVYLERGAAGGSVDATYRLADVYIHGRVAPIDEKRGFNYMLTAARHGARTAIFNTGAMYANGRGTKQDYTEALAWLWVAQHFGADAAAAAQIRNYLKTKAPDQLTVAERRSKEILAEIEAATKDEE